MSYSNLHSFRIYVSGVVSSNNLIWHNNRRFSLRQLRDLGMGKSKLVEAVQERAMWLVENFSKHAGNGAPIALPIKIAITNVIWQLVGGKQFEGDDPKMIEFDTIIKDFLDSESMYAIQDFLPWIRYLMPAALFKRLTKDQVINNTLDRLLKFFYGAVLNTAIFTIHNDPRYWDKPEEFKPERWLDQDGKFVTKKEGFLPFGVGKRQCLGESLARMEMLIFTATLLRQLSFAPAPGKTINLNADPANPFLQLPIAQELLVTVRT
ncbi:Cytochrome P450 2L1 [Portunus trituberculatus]|uniref:Cytochrome P450 2L1 n=1 Tax=Portunus trituberculatus TaxID=210409 RepID=A0A5B7FRF7_PORTR|nr:Cytochrome P450 2L1 [Portunus trituberculatus]